MKNFIFEGFPMELGPVHVALPALDFRELSDQGTGADMEGFTL